MNIYPKIKYNDKITHNKLFMKIYNIIKKIYNSIKIDELNINFEKKNDKNEKYIETNKFISGKMKDLIIQKLKYIYKINFENNEIIYITSKKTESSIISDVLIMFKIIKTLKILFKRDPIFQKVIYFDSNEKKEFPKTEGQSLGPHECNSGLSYLNNDQTNNGLIVIYRHEEHYKVLIHELIHANYIDHHIIKHDEFKNKMNHYICSKYTILLSEASTETYATILNIFFVNIHQNRGKRKLEAMFQNELNYNTFIYSKILDYYKIDDITVIFRKNRDIECTHFFPQETNVFSYYILKNILMHKHNDFANFLFEEKSEIKILENLIFQNLELINQNYKKPRFFKSKSLRMTLNQI